MENTEAVNPPGWNDQVEDDPLKTSEFRRSGNRFADKNMRHSELQGEAQPGRAPASDAGGRRFESCHPDQLACLAQRQSPRLISAVIRVRLSGMHQRKGLRLAAAGRHQTSRSSAGESTRFRAVRAGVRVTPRRPIRRVARCGAQPASNTGPTARLRVRLPRPPPLQQGGLVAQHGS
jgi:hypothetical protein